MMRRRFLEIQTVNSGKTPFCQDGLRCDTWAHAVESPIRKGPMLFTVSSIKLIAEIALLALFGQWVLGLLAGAKKDTNLFYQVLQIAGKPFVVAARFITPKQIIDRHVPLVAFLLLLFVWIAATLLKIRTCLEIGVELCK